MLLRNEFSWAHRREREKSLDRLLWHCSLNFIVERRRQKIIWEKKEREKNRKGEWEGKNAKDLKQNWEKQGIKDESS